MVPFDIDEANPTNTATVSDYPANERSSRKAIHDAYETEHYEADGRHRLGYGNDAARDAAMTSPSNGNVWVNTDGSMDVYDSGAWTKNYYGAAPVAAATVSFAGKMSVAAFDASTPPTGWLECNGAAVSRTTYSDLFTAIGTAFGVGDGSTTFNLPDMAGKFVAGFDTAAADADYDTIGETGGSKTHALTAAESPTAASSVTGLTVDANTSTKQTSGSGTNVAHKDHAHTVTDAGHTHAMTGTGAAHENRPPFIVVAWVIKT